MKIKVEVAVPQGKSSAMQMPSRVHPAHKSAALCTRVKEAMDNIESGFTPVDDDWDFLRKVQEQLQKRPKRTDPLQKLLDKIDDFMYKYGKHSADNEHAGEIE